MWLCVRSQSCFVFFVIFGIKANEKQTRGTVYIHGHHVSVLFVVLVRKGGAWNKRQSKQRFVVVVFNQSVHFHIHYIVRNDM